MARHTYCLVPQQWPRHNYLHLCLLLVDPPPDLSTTIPVGPLSTQSWTIQLHICTNNTHYSANRNCAQFSCLYNRIVRQPIFAVRAWIHPGASSVINPFAPTIGFHTTVKEGTLWLGWEHWFAVLHNGHSAPPTRCAVASVVNCVVLHYRASLNSSGASWGWSTPPYHC